MVESYDNTYYDKLREMFDEQFSVSSFVDKIEADNHSSKDIILSAKDSVKKALSRDSEETKYYVDMSAEVKQALESGEVEFVKGGNGEVYAQLRNANGRFGKKLSITEDLDDAGINYDELRAAIQMEAIAEQLKEVVSTLKEIEAQLSDSIADHRNDRIGLFYSGMSLYMEAKHISDDAFRKQIMAQALKAISDANSQMIQDIRTGIEFLATEQYKGRKKPKELVAENIKAIKQCYEIVYKSTIMKALIYYENYEMVAMATAIGEYSEFIENLIVPYTGMLSELDKDSKFIAQGPWGKIANTRLECDDIKKILSGSDNHLVIEMRDNHD